MVSFGTRYKHRIYTEYMFFVCVCVFFLFYGSLWSDSNKERKKEKRYTTF